MKFEEIENNIEEIRRKNSSDFQEKRNRIIQELDFLLEKERDLLEIQFEYDRAMRAVNSDEAIINLAIDSDYGFKLGRAFFESIFEKKDIYNKEYYRFIFQLHSLICAPKLHDKTMMHFNYQIPLGSNYKNTHPSHLDINVEDSSAIDMGFYQFELLEIWRRLRKDQIKNVVYVDVKNLLLNDFSYFSYADIAVTKNSNGKSRAENSLDFIEKTFRKIGLIDKKNRLTIFGVFCIELLEKIPNQVRSVDYWRGFVSHNKLLVKPLNDLIINFNLDDFDNLNFPASNSDLEKLKSKIVEYKSDLKNIKLFNLLD
jgi:hypothetical protein